MLKDGRKVKFRKARILIAADNELIRALLISLFRDAGSVEVVGEASNGSEAIEMTRDLVPNAVFMDIEMPRISGIAATRTIRSEFPDISIIGLSIHDEPDLREEMLEAGAVCCLSKNKPWDITLSTIAKALDHARTCR
jgi:DNA-binding NarL/FixJ family response regulator